MSTLLTHARLILSSTVAIAVMVPRVAAAQDDCTDLLECAYCIDSNEQAAHKFTQIGATGCNNDELNPYHTNWYIGGYCDDHHGTCYPPRLVEHTDAVAKMVAEADVRGLARYTVSFPGQVTFNLARGAVQLHGCGGNVMGHLPIPKETVVAVQVAIAEDLHHVALTGKLSRMPAEEPLSFVRYLELAAS
jgi:hypothetical protein